MAAAAAAGSMPSRPAARQSSSGSPTGSAAASCSSRRVSAGSCSSRAEEPLDPCGRRSGTIEAARELGRAHAARQLQQRERIAPRLRDDALRDAWVDRPGDGASSAGRARRRSQARRGGAPSARRAAARDSAHGRRRRSPSAPRASAAPRSRGPGPRRRRATAHRPRHTAATATLAAAAIRLRVASPTSKRSGVAPEARPNATQRASRCGSASESSPPSSGMQSWCSPANGSSISDSTPVTWTVWNPDAASATNRSSAVLPTPGSPRMTSVPLRLWRADSRSRSRASRSADRPRNAVGRESAAMGKRTLVAVSNQETVEPGQSWIALDWVGGRDGVNDGHILSRTQDSSELRDARSGRPADHGPRGRRDPRPPGAPQNTGHARRSINARAPSTRHLDRARVCSG